MSAPGVGAGPSRAVGNTLACRHDADGLAASPTHPVASGRTTRRSVRAWLVGQFGHPRGVAGRLAGCVMAHRPSNRQRKRLDGWSARRAARVARAQDRLWPWPLASTTRLMRGKDRLGGGHRSLRYDAAPGAASQSCGRRVGKNGPACGVGRRPTGLRDGVRRCPRREHRGVLARTSRSVSRDSRAAHTRGPVRGDAATPIEGSDRRDNGTNAERNPSGPACRELRGRDRPHTRPEASGRLCHRRAGDTHLADRAAGNAEASCWTRGLRHYSGFLACSSNWWCQCAPLQNGLLVLWPHRHSAKRLVDAPSPCGASLSAAPPPRTTYGPFGT